MDATRWKFGPGDRVVSLKNPTLGVGTVMGVAVDVLHVYVGRNEWVLDYTTYATVTFDDRAVDVKLSDLVSESQVNAYDSLVAGDLVVFGKKKMARGLVLRVLPHRGRRPHVTRGRVIVIVDGSKMTLPVRCEIVEVHRDEGGVP